nr:unnamed protein product [Digitaria exilis]
MHSPLFSQWPNPPVALSPTSFIAPPSSPAPAFTSFLGSPQSLTPPASTSTGPKPDSSAATKFMRMSSQLRSRSTTARKAASSGEHESVPSTMNLVSTMEYLPGCAAVYAHLPRARSRWCDRGKNPTSGATPERPTAAGVCCCCCQVANAKERASASGSTSSSATATADVRMSEGRGRKRELRDAEAARRSVTRGGNPPPPRSRTRSGVEGLHQSTTTASTNG